MGTRAAIAYPKGDDWVGIYHHGDGYPEGLGKDLWDMAHTDRFSAISDLTEYAVKQHPGGWNSIIGEDCYCHEEGRELLPMPLKGDLCGQDCEAGSCDPFFIEWVYILYEHQMTILYSQSTNAPFTSFGLRHDGSEWSMDRHRYTHKFLTTVDLTGLEPNWADIEAMAERVEQHA